MKATPITQTGGIRLFLQASQVLAILFGVVSLLMVLAAFDEDQLENERLLHQPDVVLGLSVRSVLFLAAGFCSLAGLCLLLARDPAIKALLMFWVSSICLAYRLGLGWLSPNHPCALLTLMAHKMGLTPKSAGHLSGVLFIGSVSIGIAMLVMERRRLKQIRNAKFMERYRQFRERGTPLSK